ncbi:MAG: CoA-transferase [Dehalococcoidia bacterium]
MAKATKAASKTKSASKTAGKKSAGSELATDYTLEEQLCCALAREFGPEDRIATSGVLNWTLVGQGIAQKLYAPQLALHQDYSLAGGAGCLVDGPQFPWQVGDPPEEILCAKICSEDIFAMVLGGKWCIMMQPVQVDKYGNCNLALVGDPKKPDRFFVGSRGLPDNSTNAVRCYFTVPNHQKRVFVDNVDFRSSAGWGPERKAGDIPYGAVEKVFTNLCVFDIDPETKQMRLASVHKGISVDYVLENTGFEPIMPKGGVPETCIPTNEEIRLIREVIDGAGINRLDHGTPEQKKATFDQINAGTKFQQVYPGRR